MHKKKKKENLVSISKQHYTHFLTTRATYHSDALVPVLFLMSLHMLSFRQWHI